MYEYDAEVLGNTSSVEVIAVNSGVVRYVIVKGDTLFSLAKRYNTSVDAIKNLNNMTTNNLDLGQEILIPN